MPAIEAAVSQDFSASPQTVKDALSDYREVRPEILPEQITDYSVVSGGRGEGTIAQWRLHATKKRIRSIKASVTVEQNSITERDENSTLINRFVITPSGTGSTVTLTTSWTGGTGVKGFFERTFAPLGLKRIHGELLNNLGTYLNNQNK